jgi:hypothetical protein
VQALKVTTDGSMFNTVLYARATCDQPADGASLACNDDDYDHAPASTIYLTSVMSGQQLYLVVDGNAAGGMDVPSSGEFTLTVSAVTLGAAGAPCRPMADGSMAPRCDGNVLCSAYGGAADGTPLCVPGVANNAACDTRGFTNTCSDANATCVSDPSPADGAMPMAVCSLAGAHVGAPCRMTDPRCDGGAVCGTGENPVCVRVVTASDPCDPTGATNSCPSGMTCHADSTDPMMAATGTCTH